MKSLKLLFLTIIFLFIQTAVFIPGCIDRDEGPGGLGAVPEQPMGKYTYTVVNTFDHDYDAFTQGLVYHADGYLYEGTGKAGDSSLRKVELTTGEVLRKYDLSGELFGEGIVIWEDRIYQLTYKAGRCFVYDLETFESQKEFTYDTEGWGLIHDGENLIMSDGSSQLFFRDPETFEIVKTLDVTYNGKPVVNINELEYIDGVVYANIAPTDLIAFISPVSGTVLGYLDLTGILDKDNITGIVNILNGIAYDDAGDRLFVTGKWWPYLFEIKMVKM